MYKNTGLGKKVLSQDIQQLQEKPLDHSGGNNSKLFKQPSSNQTSGINKHGFEKKTDGVLQAKEQPKEVNPELLRKINEYELKLNQLKEKEGQLNDTFRKDENEFKSLEKEHNRRKDARDKLTKVNYELVAENNRLKTQLDIYNSKSNDAVKVNELMLIDEAEVQKLQSLHDELTQKNAGLTAESLSLKREHAKSSDFNQRLVTLNNEKVTAIKQLELQLSQLDSDLSNLKQQLAELTPTNHLQQPEYSISSTDETVKLLRSQIGEQKRMNAKLNAELADIKNKYADAINPELQNDLTILKGEIEVVSVKCDEYRRIIEDIIKNNQELYKQKLKMQKSIEKKILKQLADGWYFMGTLDKKNKSQYPLENGTLYVSDSGFDDDKIINFGTIFCNKPNEPVLYNRVAGRTSKTSSLIEEIKLGALLKQLTNYIKDQVPLQMQYTVILAKFKETYAQMEKVNNKYVPNETAEYLKLYDLIRTAKNSGAQLGELDQPNPDQIEMLPGIVAIKFEIYDGNIFNKYGHIRALIVREGIQVHPQGNKYFYITREI